MSTVQEFYRFDKTRLKLLLLHPRLFGKVGDVWYLLQVDRHSTEVIIEIATLPIIRANF